MNNRYKGTFNLPASGYKQIPTSVDYGGHIKLDDVYDIGFSMVIGDYILIDWKPGKPAQFNRYGNYGWGSDHDNIDATDIPMELFHDAVGKSFAPSEIVDISEAKEPLPLMRSTPDDFGGGVKEWEVNSGLHGTYLKHVKKGDYIKLKPTDSAPVWIRGDYDRASKKYSISKADDICHESLKKGDTVVYIDFTY